MDQKLRNFVFTLNNYSIEEMGKIDNIKCNYIIYGEEKGESGTPHLQGYCELASARHLKSIKKDMPRSHIELRRGTAKQASEYCKKEGKFKERGTISNQGARNDITAVYEHAKNRMGMKEFLDTKPNFQDIRIFEIARVVYEIDRDFKPYVEWIYGETGTGKTRFVVETEKDLWISGKNLRWWSGYENQEAVLLDDFRKDFCTFHELLRILDRYPYTVEVKGGTRKLNSKRMYITSCFHPEEVYKTGEDVKQLLRRIDKITEL